MAGQRTQISSSSLTSRPDLLRTQHTLHHSSTTGHAVLTTGDAFLGIMRDDLTLYIVDWQSCIFTAKAAEPTYV